MLSKWKACVFFWIILRGIASGYSCAAIRFDNKKNKTQLSQLQRPWILPSTLKVELVTISWLQHFPIVKSGTDGRRVKGRRARGCSYQSHVRLLAHLFPKARAQRAWQWVHMTAGYQKGRHRPVVKHQGLMLNWFITRIFITYWYLLTATTTYYSEPCHMISLQENQQILVLFFVVLTLICLILPQNISVTVLTQPAIVYNV